MSAATESIQKMLGMDFSDGGYVAELDGTLLGLRPGLHQVKFQSFDAYQQFLKDREEGLKRHAAFCEEALAKQDWWQLSALCDSQNRIPKLQELWDGIPQAQRSEALTAFYALSDYPSLCTDFLYYAFEGRRVFDSERAQAAYRNARQNLTIYRGTTEAEFHDGGIGVSWTTRKKTALFFASKHFRFRRTDSPPILLTQQIDKDQINGWFWDRDEYEVIFTGGLDYKFTQTRL